MKKKNIIISSVISGTVLLGLGVTYFVTANRDATCYTFNTSVSACAVTNQAQCDASTNWVNGVKKCSGIATTTYSVKSSYRCSGRGTANTKVPTTAACTIEYIDKITPSVTGGGIQ